jgi:hypothetical protein
MQFSLAKTNDKILLSHSNEVAAHMYLGKWKASSNPKIGSKIALKIFTSLHRSHELSWGKADGLAEALNSGREIKKRPYQAESKEQIIIYEDESNTLRTFPGNTLIASRESNKDEKWIFNTDPLTPEALAKKVFLIAHKNDFIISPKELINTLNGEIKTPENDMVIRL